MQISKSQGYVGTKCLHFFYGFILPVLNMFVIFEGPDDHTVS